MYDLLIKNCCIIDGSGEDPFAGDVAVRKGKIAAVGENLSGAERTIDAAGRVVTPGFIDIHRHADGAAFRPDFGKLELKQGLTTIVSGNCGLSAAPIDGDYRQAVLDYLRPITGALGPETPTASMAEYLAAAESLHPAIHVGMLAGAGTARAAVAGYACEHLNAGQLGQVQARLHDALSEGALGISLGLGYAPECFYTTEELIDTLRPFAHGPIPITVHMREEGDGVLEALEEMLTVAETLDLPVEISHLKAMGKRNWNNKVPKALEMLAEARERGVQASCDAYPYTAGSTQLIHILPHDFLVGGTQAITRRLHSPQQRKLLTHRIQTGTDFDNIAGMVGWENILCSTLRQPENQPYQGLSVAEIARRLGKDPFETAYDLLVSEDCEITMIDFIADESDIIRILQDDTAAVISDSTYPTEGQPHPRVYGTFARVIERYVGEQRVLSLPKAVRKMTALPAQRLRLRGKGLLREGWDADLCIFDPAEVHERGSYSEPCRYAEGMDYVLVNGIPAIVEGMFADLGNGEVIRRN